MITGEWNYTSYAVASAFQVPVAALMDVSHQIKGDYSAWTPRSGQVLGTLTTPLSPAPVKYQVDLPIVPQAAQVDLDNDGQTDDGVMIYALTVSTNLVGDSYLEQNEQLGFTSYLSDPQTGAIREGTFLIYAPNSEQGFPSSAGADKQFFTADDPSVAVPGGYTLVTLASDGSVTFNRSFEARMDIREPAAYASPNFAEQGILESYNSLIDVLKVRYSFTQLRGLDWEQIRQEYLPQVQAADAAGDMAAYYGALWDLAQSIKDSHVQVTSSDAATRLANLKRIRQPAQATLGARVSELSDGRFIITFVAADTPAAQAGWQFGTEIISVDGVPMNEYVDTLPYFSPESTAEGIRVARMQNALTFAEGSSVTVEYRLSGGSETRSATLTSGDYANAPDTPLATRESISFKALENGYGYIQWTAFNDLLYKIAVWEKFLATFHDAPGIVVDLRGNVGGNVGLLNTLAAYLFSADKPLPMHWIDTYVFDEQKNDLVREFATDYVLSAPKPELAYSGKVVVLVDENSASAAEYFPQLLQRNQRALVVGEHGTDGAGGVIERVSLPGGITFQFTKGRSVFAGTDELNLEGKGVTLDVRVPITEENERAKLDGRDPVLEAAVTTLNEQIASAGAAKLTSGTWKWTAWGSPDGKLVNVEKPDAYSVQFGTDGTFTMQADCNQVGGTYTSGAGSALTITFGPATTAECGADSQSEEFIKFMGAAQSFAFQNGQLVIVLDPQSGAVALALDPAE